MVTTKLYTDEELQELREIPKRVTNPRARWSKKPANRPVHNQRSFKTRSEQNADIPILPGQVVYLFEICQRQNILDGKDFSCGIAYLPPGGSRLTLARYNGPSHQAHEDIVYRPHIHSATAAAMAAGKRPEHGATETNRYETLEGALACLLRDFNIAGLTAEQDQPRLFPDGT